MGINAGNCKVQHLVEDNPMHLYRLGADRLESSFAGKDLELLADTKLNVSQQCALAAKAANSIRGCTTKGVASSSRALPEAIIPLCSLSPGEAHLECCGQLGTLPEQESHGCTGLGVQ